VGKDNVTNPHVFIVGCPRSGTTLLQRMANAHPQLAITPETQWIPRFLDKRWGVTRDGLATSDICSRLLEHPGFVGLGISREELLALMRNAPTPYASLVTGIFDLYGKAQGKPLVGDKTPGYVRRMRTLHALWPQARFVHLIRDGRDVYLSMAARPLEQRKPGVFDTWAKDPATTAALWWELNVRPGREVGQSLGAGLYYETRYESLVADPREECERLCAFLGVPFDGAMLRFHEGREGEKPEAGGKPAWRPIVAGLRDWRSQMSAEDVEQFEAAVGDLLEELGYERAVPRPRLERVEAASRIRQRLARDPRTHYGRERKELSARR
jgi:hypothetical protein